MQQNQPVTGQFVNATQPQAAVLPKDYVPGATDTRGWGMWEATGVETDDEGQVIACEKRITVNAVSADPNKVGLLSLQSHDQRDELWRVESGVLTVILEDQRHTLTAGQEIIIPVKALHAMANLGNVPAVVFERQTGADLGNGKIGVCQEDDIHRFSDALGRATEPVVGEVATASLAVYTSVRSELAQRQAQLAQTLAAQP